MAAILDFTDVKNVTEWRGPGLVFYVDIIFFKLEGTASYGRLLLAPA